MATLPLDPATQAPPGSESLVLNASFPTFGYSLPTDATLNLHGPADLGGSCCAHEDEHVVAYVSGLVLNGAYQFQVFAGSFSDKEFETVGSNIATGYTTAPPNPVTSLESLYLIGANQTRLRWSDPGGERYCGRTLFQLFRSSPSSGGWTKVPPARARAPRPPCTGGRGAGRARGLCAQVNHSSEEEGYILPVPGAVDATGAKMVDLVVDGEAGVENLFRHDPAPPRPAPPRPCPCLPPPSPRPRPRPRLLCPRPCCSPAPRALARSGRAPLPRPDRWCGARARGARGVCENHLGRGAASIPDVTFLDGAALARVDGVPLAVTLRLPPDQPVSALTLEYVTESHAFLSWAAPPRASLFQVELSSAPVGPVAGPWAPHSAAPGANASADEAPEWSDWAPWSPAFPAAAPGGAAQLFRTTEAELSGLAAGRRYRFRVRAGSMHGALNGSLVTLSAPIGDYTVMGPPEEGEVALALHKFNASSISVRWSGRELSSVDPANYSAPLFLLHVAEGGAAFGGGGDGEGCSTGEVAEGALIGPPPGCRSVEALNVSATGVTRWGYTLAGLQGGAGYAVRVTAFNMHSPRPRRLRYAGKATACICAATSAGGSCLSYRLIGETRACVLAPDTSFLQPPASSASDAYAGLYAMVRSGAGEGQERLVTAYGGADRRLTVAPAWDIQPDATSLVELFEPSWAHRGTLTGVAASCSVSSCAAVRLAADASVDATAYDGGFVTIAGNACGAQRRRIYKYAPASKEAHVYPPFTCLPDTDHDYTVSPHPRAPRPAPGDAARPLPRVPRVF